MDAQDCAISKTDVANFAWPEGVVVTPYCQVRSPGHYWLLVYFHVGAVQRKCVALKRAVTPRDLEGLHDVAVDLSPAECDIEPKPRWLKCALARLQVMCPKSTRERRIAQLILSSIEMEEFPTPMIYAGTKGGLSMVFTKGGNSRIVDIDLKKNVTEQIAKARSLLYELIEPRTTIEDMMALERVAA